MRFLGLLSFGVLFFLFCGQASASPASRCGGDGPQPFTDISVGIPKTKTIPINGEVNDFVYWENRDSVVYRNTRGQIYSRGLANGWEIHYGSSGVALSPVVNATEEAILLDKTTNYYEFGYWHSFYMQAVAPKHLFWEGKYLFMLETVAGTSQYSQQLQSHRYRDGLGSARYLCRYLVPVGEKYLQAEGASYPVVPFYKVRPTPQGNELSIYEMDVRNCNVSLYGTYKDLFEGKILSVHRYGNLKSYAVQTDHPTKNLMWDYGTGCEFFSIGQGQMLFPSHDRAVVGAWVPGTGLELMNLTSKHRAVYFSGASPKTVRPRDLVLAKSRGKALFSPDGEKTGRQLFEIDVKDILP